ncbi:MAG: DUF4258 domain-containing protein, partial [Nanoarchaeota archaeon]|nr:DUF4258 domain-containing protein [Nanoarchaeota archaeon]
MKIEYTKHAKEKLDDRKIPKSIVESILKKPDKTIETKFGRKIAQKAIDDKLLRIVYEEQKGIYIIITVYYTRP